MLHRPADVGDAIAPDDSSIATTIVQRTRNNSSRTAARTAGFMPQIFRGAAISAVGPLSRNRKGAVDVVQNQLKRIQNGNLSSRAALRPVQPTRPTKRTIEPHQRGRHDRQDDRHHGGADDVVTALQRRRPAGRLRRLAHRRAALPRLHRGGRVLRPAGDASSAG